MSIFASILRSVYKLSGAKKAFALPEDALRTEIEKQNRHRGVFTPTDCKAHYETITVNGFPCLIVRAHPKPSERAILYFFGGGMVIGPDKGDLPVMRKLCRETGCDVWFPFYPLCMEHCITETYAMVYECYRKMITLYGCENVPDYMLSGSRGDFTGVGDIHFFYSADEVLYGALPDFEEACKRANVPYTVSARPKMVHCYCMLPIFKEAKEDFSKIVEILKK